MTKPSTLRLSDVARHVVMPSGIVTTGWPAVEAKLRDMGLAFDPWQCGAARLILGKRKGGLYAASIGGVFMSIPRQVGKTFMVGSLVFALCLLNPGMTAIWTAHRTRTANETFQSMQGMAARKKIAPFVSNIRAANGEQSIMFVNGSRILFGAREAGFGRGFSEVDVIVFDEAQILSESALDDMVPATNQSRQMSGPLVLYMGTPPRPQDLNKGTVFLDRRKEALSGESDDMVFIEFSGDDGCDPEKWPAGKIDWEQIKKANPSFPARTPRHAILRMFKNLGPASFRREGLGVWDAGLGEQSVISSAAWKALQGKAMADGILSYAVRFSAGEVALAVAVADSEHVHVEVIDARPIDDGNGWIVDFLARHAAGCDMASCAGCGPARWEDAAQIVVDGKEGAALLVSDLRAAGVRRSRITAPTTDQVIAAHTTFLAAVNGKSLSHFGQGDLTAQVLQAGKRKIGALGGWGWSPLGDNTVTLLEAVTLAAWGAKTKASRPKSRPRMRGYSGG